jgi:DNA helicase II / ATP-dependent DNA helicase PcrA
MKWSNLQTNIFNFVEFDSGNAIIEAVAGSGKTTTIVEAINRVPATQSAIFLAFNKSIADELKARGVNAKTFHSLCCGAAMRALGCNTVNANKSFELMRKHFSEDENFKYSSFVTQLVGLGKQVGVGCLVPDTQQVWYDIIDHHDMEPEKENTSITRAMEIASELLTLSNSSNMIDFDDMLYIPVLMGLSLPKFYFIFVDEAQDTNAIQRAILRKIMGPRSRMVAVGDPAQAIYGFRGSDSNSLNRIQKEFNCKRFPLSVSYRCDSAIVDYARNWVDHIQARPDAPAGEVRHLNYEWDVKVFDPADLVVCRTTRPLIALAFKMLRARIPVTVMGREIGQGLVKLIQKFKTNEISVLETKIEWWAKRETEKAVAKMDESKAAAIEDKAQCLLMLAKEIGEEGGDVQSLIDTINELFIPTRNSTTLATIHKAKGLEADTVYWLNASQCPSKWARQHWQKVQEANLCYVATTRAKSLLCLIEMGDDK